MSDFSYQKEPSVGEKVYDILSKPQSDVEVGEITSQYAASYFKALQRAVDEGIKASLPDPFHVVVLHKKEPWAMNVLRNWFVSRPSCPTMQKMWRDYSNFMHTVYRVHKKTAQLEMLWTLPSPAEAKVILKNSHLYDAQLCEWIRKAFQKEETLKSA